MANDLMDRRAQAVHDFSNWTGRSDGLPVIGSLIDGLNLLRETFFERIHRDVEDALGTDSILLPVSTSRSVTATNVELGAYQVAEASVAVRELHLLTDPSWFPDWLAQFWLGELADRALVTKRIHDYLSRSANERRRSFSTRLVQVFPEAGRAPLVIYRLFPLANALATCVAFRDSTQAAELRKQQITWLGVIRDCPKCRGRVFENGEQCPQCGNPFWKYEWLTAE